MIEKVIRNLIYSGLVAPRDLLALHMLNINYNVLTDDVCCDMIKMIQAKKSTALLHASLRIIPNYASRSTFGSTQTIFYRGMIACLNSAFTKGFGSSITNILLDIPGITWAGGLVTQIIQPGKSVDSTWESGDADAFVPPLTNVM